MQILPPPPNNTSTSIGAKSPHSAGVYAKLGLLGYTASIVSSSSGLYYSSYINYDYTLVPGISVYYGWHGPSGLGVEVALEYEYNAVLGNPTPAQEKMRNFFTPALYFSSNDGNIAWRVGLGYDIGVPYSVNGQTVDNNTNVTHNYSVSAMYHGLAILASSEWVLNNNNAIGVFVKGAFRWLSINASDGFSSDSQSEFDHVLYTVGLSYRFNMGF